MDAKILADCHTKYKALCDMTILVKERKFACHSFLFFTRSSFFEDICLEKAHLPRILLDLSDLPGEAESFENILKFCYGQSPQLSCSNAYNLYSASRKLLFCKETDHSPSSLMELCEEFIDDAIQQSWQNNIAILSSLDLKAVVSSEEPVLELRTKCISKLTSYALEMQSSENYSFNDFLDFLSHLVKMEKDMLNLILTFFRVKGVTFANSGDYDEGSIGLLISGSPDDERVHCNISTVLDFLISGLLIHVERPNEQQGSVIGIKTLRSYFLLLLKACSKETLPLVTLEKIEKLQWLFLSAFNVDDLTNLSPNTVLPLIPNSFSTRSTLAVELYSAKHLNPNRTSDVADGIELVKVIALIERYLVAICERTVSMTSMESMVELAKLVANARDSHDILFDAFSALLSRNSEILDHNSRLLGSVIDAAKLSETALERALSSNFPLHHGLLSNFVSRQIEDLKSSQEENVLLKRKLDQRDECISCKSRQEEYVLLKRKLDQRDECISCKNRDISASSTISTSDHNKEKRRPISKFTIFVKPPTGKTIALLVKPSCKVWSLKAMISRRIEVPRCWWLVYQLSCLNESYTLAQLDIKKDYTLEIKFRTVPT